MKPKEKGNILEQAVEEIEKLIINNTSLGKANEISIERNKRIFQKGILLHEIDFYISINFGYSNKLIYIIECKNWDCKSISKTQVIDFERKISYVGASKGFFIAKNYSPAARLVSENNLYIDLLKFDSSEHSNIINAPGLSGLQKTSKALVTKLTLDYFDKIKGQTKPLKEIMFDKLSLFGKEMTFDYWLKSIVKIEKIKMIKNHTDEIEKSDSGTVNLDCKTKIEFNKNEVIFHKKSIKRIELEFEFCIDIYKTHIRKKFDIENKGRRIEYDLIHPTKSGYMNLTTIPNIDNTDKWDINLQFKI